MVIIATVSVFRVNDSRFEQPDLIIPHKGFLIDAVHGCELADCEKFVILIHSYLIIIYFCIDRTVTVRSIISFTGNKYKIGGKIYGKHKCI